MLFTGKPRHPRAAGICLMLCALLVCAITAPAPATVFHARDEIRSLAFPDAERMEPRDYFLTSSQREQIESRARTQLDSDLVTVYVGLRGDDVLGYAFLDTHMVRTLPETFLIVLAPDGAVVATHVMAFYEPLEYLPADRWLDQLDGSRLTDDLHVGRSIAGITGATLSSHAVVNGIRRVLAMHEILLGDAQVDARVAADLDTDAIVTNKVSGESSGEPTR